MLGCYRNNEGNYFSGLIEALSGLIQAKEGVFVGNVEMRVTS